MRQPVGMPDITVPKHQLLQILERNRTAHRNAYDRALEKFREQAIMRLDKMLAQVRAGKSPRLYVDLPVPEEHTADYDRAIQMLAMDTTVDVKLSETAYARLVDDDWGWRDSFAANTSSYLVEH